MYVYKAFPELYVILEEALEEDAQSSNEVQLDEHYHLDLAAARGAMADEASRLEKGFNEASKDHRFRITVDTKEYVGNRVWLEDEHQHKYVQWTIKRILPDPGLKMVEEGK